MINILSSNNYHEVLSVLYQTDKDLLSTFHIKAGEGLEACVEDTCSVFKDCPSFGFFEIRDNDLLIGYFGKETIEDHDFLTGFFIHPEYRKKDIWSHIKSNFKTPFYLSLYSKNQRAIKFLLKNNANILTKTFHDNHEMCVLEVN